MTLADYAARIRRITEDAHSESALQVKLEGVLADLLKAVGVDYDPAVNESLRSQGISQSDSSRPDSLFGHVVLDYKAPHLLSTPRELERAKAQVEQYLQSTSFLNEPQKWAGVLWDGTSLCFCHSDGAAWRWSRLCETSAASLLTLIGLYRCDRGSGDSFMGSRSGRRYSNSCTFPAFAKATNATAAWQRCREQLT